MAHGKGEFNACNSAAKHGHTQPWRAIQVALPRLRKRSQRFGWMAMRLNSWQIGHDAGGAGVA